MTQQEHLTTEQLSAFLDKQLTPQEQAFFDAHLQSCQHCQNTLAELRLTVVLLHAMPQPELPRSFALPAAISPIQIQAARPQIQPAPQRRVLRYTLQRTVRAVSTLAAVIGLLFILSGLLANVHLSFGGATTASPAFSNATTHAAAGQASTQTPKTTLVPSSSAASPTISGRETTTPAKTPKTTPKPSPVGTKTAIDQTSNGGGVTPPTQTPTLPAVLDLGQPAGRLTLGALLFLLSIVGIVTTRRRRNTAS